MSETTTKPQTVTVIGRRWFEKTNGNTYHSWELYVDGEFLHRQPFAYGYDRQYLWNAMLWLCESGRLGGPEAWAHNPGTDRQMMKAPHILRDEIGFRLIDSVSDVPRKKDL